VADTEVALKSAADRRRDIVNVLTAEHSNLQAARSAGVAEMNGRTTSFFAALSGTLVALALVSQVEALRDVLLLAAVVFAFTAAYIGLITYFRLVQLLTMDSLLVIGINRVRRRYMEILPEVEDVQFLPTHDDNAGVNAHAGLERSGGRLDTLASAPSMVAGVDGILVGVIGALGATAFGAPGPVAMGLGIALLVATDAVSPGTASARASDSGVRIPHATPRLSEVPLGRGEPPRLIRQTACLTTGYCGSIRATAPAAGAIQRDDPGYILTSDSVNAGVAGGRPPPSLRTSDPGIFAVGDVRAGSMKRVAAAVGEGSYAIRLVHEHLAGRDPTAAASTH
jgi:hypothetical protein